MIYLAIKHILSRKKQTLLIVLGIMIGSMGYVVISSVILGVQNFITYQLINNDAHIRILARDEPITEQSITEELYKKNEMVKWVSPPSGRRGYLYIEYPHGWFEKLSIDPRVIAYTPSLVSQVIYRRGNNTVVGALNGIFPHDLARITNINDNMKAGRLEDIGQSGNRIVVGQGLMEKLGAKLNDTILLSSGFSSPEPFKIVGYFSFGIKQIDDTIAYGALTQVQNLNKTPSRISSIAVRITDVNAAGSIAEEWSLTGREKVLSWQEVNKNIMSAFVVQDTMRYVVSIAILTVAGFGIYNVLTVMISQKQQEIAILRSIGYNSFDITELFLLQGLMLGFAGGLAGIFAGFLLSSFLGTIQVFPESSVRGGRLPIAYEFSIYSTAFLLAFISSIFASILPARFAGKMTPIEIIRKGTQ